MNILVKPCDGMTEPEAMLYAVSIFEGQKVDWKARKEGRNEGVVLMYNDDTVAYFYRTKENYVVRFDRKGRKA